MVDANDVMMVSVAFLIGYAVIRMWLTSKRPAPLQTQLQQILTGEQYKVKGRVESRADNVE